MSGERQVDRGDSLLTNEERANGFFIVADGQHKTTLLKWGKPVAWFSAVVTVEVMRGIIELIKHLDESQKG